MIRLSFPNVPLAVLPRLGEQLRHFGVEVLFESESSGWISSLCGRASFEHSEGKLTILVVEDRGHFPHKMLIGGIRQLVEEAIESWEQCGVTS